TTYRELPDDDHRKLVRTLFLRLIEPGAAEQDATRRRLGSADLTLADLNRTQMLHESVDRFVKARLLTASQAEDGLIIEVSHEALIREWARLQEWLREARGDVQFEHSLAQASADWK